MARTKKGDEHAPRNSATASQAIEIIESIEAQKRGLIELHMEYMNDCQPYHERIKEIIDQGVNVYGMTRKAIKAKVVQRSLYAKAEAVQQKLDAEEAEAFDKLSEQLGELGAAARDSYQRGNGQGDRASA